MADNKKYYYLKLKENFFDSDSMVLLESMQDGILYSNILMKMYLKSLKNNGKLVLNDAIPYNTQMIATVTRHQVGTVEKAIDVFEQLGLIDILDGGTIYMSDIELFVGKSSTEGDRKRAERMKLKHAENLALGQMSDIHPPEIEIEKEIEKENRDRVKRKEKEKEAEDLFERLWKIYPEKKGKGQVSKNSKERLLVIGYEQFERAINRYKEDLKENEWRKPQYGSTFFNTGYEDYLDKNYQPPERTAKPPVSRNLNNFERRGYDMDSLEEQLLNSN